jgi:diadenosine tetraphosphate (Ap4A) HIT family hydrolase
MARNTTTDGEQLMTAPEITAAEPDWVLDPGLAADTITVGELSLSRLLLSRDGNYPWLILVPRRNGAREIVDLDAADRDALMTEIALASEALKAVTGCHKLNVAAIGNVIAQLHVHVIARRHDDCAWPRPVWGAVPARAWDPAARDRLVAALSARLATAWRQ